MSANTQDLIVQECSAKPNGEVTCQVVWQGEIRFLSIEAILNEINKTAVFAHGYAEAAQEMAKRR